MRTVITCAVQQASHRKSRFRSKCILIVYFAHNSFLSFSLLWLRIRALFVFDHYQYCIMATLKHSFKRPEFERKEKVLCVTMSALTSAFFRSWPPRSYRSARGKGVSVEKFLAVTLNGAREGMRIDNVINTILARDGPVTTSIPIFDMLRLAYSGLPRDRRR